MDEKLNALATRAEVTFVSGRLGTLDATIKDLNTRMGTTETRANDTWKERKTEFFGNSA